ncbi:MAG: ATP-binding protein [Verrucomicrobia bacterium]|nr:ATP-binding protein [Verrucomicrobiota bacterium]
MSFVGRTPELSALTEAWTGAKSAFIPIYGRRRTGKSRLIVEFAQGRPAIYHVGKQAPAALQRAEFMQLAATALGEPLLAQVAVEGWAQAFKLVEERWRGPGKLLLALDEFQWTAESSPELPSVLQEAWDRRWQKSGRVMLILCGSYLGFMEREVLGKKSPLFGRRTAQMLLRPFGFRDAAAFHPGWASADHAQAYFVCGGLPAYLECFERHRSIEQNLAANFFRDNGPLAREPEFLLREELRDVANYHAILHAMAAGGESTNSGIARAAGLGDRALHYYLSTLMELGYVRRRHPLHGAANTARETRYAIADPLLRFWFRFVYPNLSRIPVLGPERAVRELVRPGWAAFCGEAFERLCREALPLLHADEQVAAAATIGEFWAKDVQIDNVTLRDDGLIELGECKWGPVRSPAALRAELATKVPLFPNRRHATVHLRYFTRDRCAPPAAAAGTPPESWHHLAALYGRR